MYNYYEDLENNLIDNLIEKNREAVRKTIKEKTSSFDLFIRQSYDQPAVYEEPTEEQFQEYISLLRSLVEKYPKMILVLAASLGWLMSRNDVSHVFQFIPAYKSERVLIQSIVSTMYGNLWNEDMAQDNVLYYNDTNDRTAFDERTYLMDYLDIPYDVDFWEELISANKYHNTGFSDNDSELYKEELAVSYIITRPERSIIHFRYDPEIVKMYTCLTNPDSDPNEGEGFAKACKLKNFHHMITKNVKQQLYETYLHEDEGFEGFSNDFLNYLQRISMKDPHIMSDGKMDFYCRFLKIIRTIGKVWSIPVDISVIEPIFKNCLEYNSNHYKGHILDGNETILNAYLKFQEDTLFHLALFSINGEYEGRPDYLEGEITTYARPSQDIKRWKTYKVTMCIDAVKKLLYNERCSYVDDKDYVCTDEEVADFINEVLKPMTEPEDLQDSCMVHEAAIGSPDNIQKCITFYLYDEDITMPQEWEEKIK